MYINKITLNNFGSYYGERTFDFVSSTGQHGYAIFGEIGRGKTTIVDAVLWCLYGHVETTKEVDGKVLKKNRPLIDANQMGGEYRKKWFLPLLNFQAWDESTFNFSVRLEFEHDGRTYSLLRDVGSPRTANPKTDRDVKHQPHLTVDGKTVSAALISKEIEEIIPERIARFFFVEVDSIKSYSTLLDADGSVGGIVEDIEAILGMPSLEHSKSDFEDLASFNMNKLEKLKTRTKGNAKIKMTLDGMDEEIRELEKEIKDYGNRIEQIGDNVAEIEIALSEHTSAETHMSRLKDAKGDLKGYEEAMDKHYLTRQKKLSQGAWKFLLQPNIEKTSIRLQEKRDEQSRLDREKMSLIVKRDHLLKEVHKGGAECEACGFISEGIKPKEKEEKAGLAATIEYEIAEMQDRIEMFGKPSDDLFELSKYRDSSSYDSIKTIETQISVAEMDIKEKNDLIDEINKALEDHDVMEIMEMQALKTKLIEERGDNKGAMGAVVKHVNQVKDDRAKIAARLKTSKVDSPKIKKYEKFAEIYNWLEEVFEVALSDFKKDAKDSVEKFATAAWKYMIPEPKKYKHIKINDTWNTEVISSGGKALPITNPGHRQTLAVCIFDGLRKTSRRRFPTFFDNPGSNIGEYTLDRMASHFWDDAEDQIVMLSHRGGLKREQAMKKYGAKLARAWELSYAKGDKTTTDVEVVTS